MYKKQSQSQIYEVQPEKFRESICTWTLEKETTNSKRRNN